MQKAHDLALGFILLNFGGYILLCIDDDYKYEMLTCHITNKNTHFHTF